MAVQLLRQSGTRSFEIVEKSNNIGGTKEVNSYPGCGYDVGLQVWKYPSMLVMLTMEGAISLLFLLIRVESILVSEVRDATGDCRILPLRRRQVRYHQTCIISL